MKEKKKKDAQPFVKQTYVYLLQNKGGFFIEF